MIKKLQYTNYKWLLLLVALFALWPLAVSAWNIGDFYSERSIIFTGITTSNPIINNANTNNSFLDITMGGQLNTLSATNVTMTPAGTAAILRGELLDLNNLPNVVAHFEWGYNTSYGNTTGLQTLNVIGNVSSAIMHYDPNQTVHYRIVADDGYGNFTYGQDSTFKLVGPTPAYSMAKIIPIIVVAILIISAVGMMAAGLTIAALVTMGISLILGIAFLSAINAGLTLFW